MSVQKLRPGREHAGATVGLGEVQGSFALRVPGLKPGKHENPSLRRIVTLECNSGKDLKPNFTFNLKTNVQGFVASLAVLQGVWGVPGAERGAARRRTGGSCRGWRATRARLGCPELGTPTPEAALWRQVHRPVSSDPSRGRGPVGSKEVTTAMCHVSDPTSAVSPGRPSSAPSSFLSVCTFRLVASKSFLT